MAGSTSSTTTSLISNSSSLPSSPDFPEENLLLTRDEGFGYFPASPGMLLKQGRYEIVRKLGYGKMSSTWLVSDKQSKTPVFKTLKVLTAYATSQNRTGALQELTILKATTKLASSPSTLPASSTSFFRRGSPPPMKAVNVPQLEDSFEHTGPHGVHLCLVFPKLFTTLSNVRRTLKDNYFPVDVVKVVINGVLKGLIALHGAGIIHTDLKLNNIAFFNPITSSNVLKLLASSPMSIAENFTLNGKEHPIVKTQPLPYTIEQGMPHKVCITDVGQARWHSESVRMGTKMPFALRAPEVILRGEYDTSLDIWSIGCITYELLTGRWLFNPQGGSTWSLEDDHLAKIMELTGERFTRGFIADCESGYEYFDERNNLLRIGELFPTPIEKLIKKYNDKLHLQMSGHEMDKLAEFLRMCLRIDPADRKRAEMVRRMKWINDSKH